MNPFSSVFLLIFSADVPCFANFERRLRQVRWCDGGKSVEFASDRILGAERGTREEFHVPRGDHPSHGRSSRNRAPHGPQTQVVLVSGSAVADALISQGGPLCFNHISTSDLGPDPATQVGSGTCLCASPSHRQWVLWRLFPCRSHVPSNDKTQPTTTVLVSRRVSFHLRFSWYGSWRTGKSAHRCRWTTSVVS